MTDAVDQAREQAERARIEKEYGLSISQGMTRAATDNSREARLARMLEEGKPYSMMGKAMSEEDRLGLSYGNLGRADAIEKEYPTAAKEIRAAVADLNGQPPPPDENAQQGRNVLASPEFAASHKALKAAEGTNIETYRKAEHDAAAAEYPGMGKRFA